MTRRLLVAMSFAIAASLMALPGAGSPVRADAGGFETAGSAVDDAAQGRQGRGRGGRDGGAPARKRLLAWADTRNGQAQHASVSHALAVIERLGYDSGQWDTFIRTDSNIIAERPLKTDGSPASGGPSLASTDAIFFMGHREVPLDETQRQELLAFVRGGKGFVAAHTALTAFASWPEFLDLIGARYGGHPVSGAGTIINERPDFPATRHLPPSFPFDDEFYLPSEYSRDQIDVLLRLDLSGVEREGLRDDRDYPLAWVKNYGEGRVFFGSFAHASETWDDRDIQQMYFEAIRWALRLTDAEPAPHPMRGGQFPEERP